MRIQPAAGLYPSSCWVECFHLILIDLPSLSSEKSINRVHGIQKHFQSPSKHPDDNLCRCSRSCFGQRSTRRSDVSFFCHQPCRVHECPPDDFSAQDHLLRTRKDPRIISHRYWYWRAIKHGPDWGRYWAVSLSRFCGRNRNASPCQQRTLTGR